MYKYGFDFFMCSIATLWTREKHILAPLQEEAMQRFSAFLTSPDSLR
jgi:hypothetical protein